MTRKAHLEWHDLPLQWGTIRLYECKSVEDANAMFAEQRDFVGAVQVAVYQDGSTRLLSGLWSRRMGMEDIREMARVLFGSGIREAYMQRRDGHSVPFGELMTAGDFKGWWKIDGELLAAGLGGDY